MLYNQEKHAPALQYKFTCERIVATLKEYIASPSFILLGGRHVPHSKLHKRHNALSYHRTREAIAAGITRFHHIVGTTNTADILSKHWGHSSIWEMLRPLLFW